MGSSFYRISSQGPFGDVKNFSETLSTLSENASLPAGKHVTMAILTFENMDLSLIASVIESLGLPHDRRPLIIGGSTLLEKDAIVRGLWDLFPNTFTIPKSYTTMAPPADQSRLNGDYHYISEEVFSTMVSNGEFATYTIRPKSSFGITKQAIENAAAAGRIVIMDATMHEVQQLKSIPHFDARYVLLRPPKPETSKIRMSSGKLETESIGLYEPWRQVFLEKNFPRDTEKEEAEIEYALMSQPYDKVISSENLDVAFLDLLDVVLEHDDKSDETDEKLICVSMVWREERVDVMVV
ncbi:guanylate kinase domain-containing protein [Sarocladium implicatum]|nr:guanylate kinase domain-containing protein [Sarocladium implicatum]